MQNRTGKIPYAGYPARGAKVLSRAAGQRLRWMDHYESHGRNAALTCRYFGISRQTFYRWRRRYDPQDLSRLEERSHRPHRRRQKRKKAEELKQKIAALSPPGDCQLAPTKIKSHRFYCFL